MARVHLFLDQLRYNYSNIWLLQRPRLRFLKWQGTTLIHGKHGSCGWWYKFSGSDGILKQGVLSFRLKCVWMECSYVGYVGISLCSHQLSRTWGKGTPNNDCIVILWHGFWKEKGHHILLSYDVSHILTHSCGLWNPACSPTIGTGLGEIRTQNKLRKWELTFSPKIFDLAWLGSSLSSCYPARMSFMTFN